MLPREIPAAELPSTPRLNAIMDRAMAKVKALLYELEMDRGKKHNGERGREGGRGKKQRKNETRKEGRRGNEKEGRKEDKNKNRKRGRVEVIFLCFPPTYATLTPLQLHTLRASDARSDAVTQFPLALARYAISARNAPVSA